MSDQPNGKIKIGIGVHVFHDGKILLGKRKGAHAAGEWAGPGGHMEYGESFADAARREVREETGLEITNIRFQVLGNFTDWPPDQYIHVGLVADAVGGAARLMEPDKCAGWEWFDLDRLPSPLLKTVEIFLKNLKTGQQYFDINDT